MQTEVRNETVECLPFFFQFHSHFLLFSLESIFKNSKKAKKHQSTDFILFYWILLLLSL